MSMKNNKASMLGLLAMGAALSAIGESSPYGGKAIKGSLLLSGQKIRLQNKKHEETEKLKKNQKQRSTTSK